MQQISKEELIRLLEESGVSETSSLRDPAITAEILLTQAHRYKIPIPEEFYIRLADRLGLAYIDRGALLSRTDLGKVLPFTVEEEAQIALLDIKPTYMRVATSNPLDPAIFLRLESTFRKTVERVVTSASAIDAFGDQSHAPQQSYSALMELMERQPDESAYRILVPWQKWAIVLFGIIILLFIVVNPFFTAFVLFTLINISYFVMNPVKFYISLKGMARTKKVIYVTDEDLKAITDDELPIYTILVPLYHESEMLPHVMLNISRLDYPHEKLDVKILMEEDDEETLGKARRLGLFGNIQEFISPMTMDEYRRFLSIFHPVVVPHAEIKTKPRACNYGLKRSRGEFVVIYDAEDYPEPDQLKKVYLAFRRVGIEYVCIQCLLNFYNPRKNMLTRWFSIEYSYYYDYYIQGLDMINAPIPLGGTSNHFRVRTLRELGGWDPFNVTEDADLGMRIARKKYRTGVLNSHTYEEAVDNVRSWIRQRSRWVKGFVITWLVTMRHPIRVFRDIGLKNFIIFHLAFGGNFYMPTMNIPLWLVFGLSFFIPAFFASWFDFWPFAVIAVFNLIVGNLFYLVLMLLATWREKQYDMLIYSLFSPAYWLLMSIGAWKGILQLLRAPYKWEKTMHGQTFINRELVEEHPDDFARPVTRIEVPVPDVKKGTVKATFPQIALSLGLTILLILLCLTVVGVIEYEQVQEHKWVSAVPGLSQALEPWQAYQEGREPDLFNVEAIPGITLTPPATLVPNQTAPAPIPRPTDIHANQREPSLQAAYDPVTGLIRVSAGGNLTPGAVYDIHARYPGGTELNRSISQTPEIVTLPAGDYPVLVDVVRVYENGVSVPVLTVYL